MKIPLALLLLCTGCASTEARRFLDDWQDARADGVIDEPDMRVLDNDAEALDNALRAPPIPHTGIPWLDAAVGVGGLLLTAAGTHKYTMKKRDKTRAKALEEAKTA